MRRWLCTAFLGILIVVSQARAQVPSPGQPPAPAPPVALPATDVFPADGYSGGDRGWAEADFLVWWMRGASLPPLITTSPPGTPLNQAGVLGTPGTTILFGNSQVNDDLRLGGRVAVGYWFTDARDLGIEADFFMLDAKDTTFAVASNGNPILARPFTDVNNGLQSSERIAFPGDTTGSVQASAASSGLLGASVLLRENISSGNGYRLDVLGGYRYLRLSDHVAISEQVTNVNPNNPNFIPVGANIAVLDSFASRNDLNALDFGLDAEWRDGPLSLNVRARIAVGHDQQDVDITGATTVTAGAAPPAFNNGGLLALAGNIGNHSRDDVSIVPEVDVKLAYQFTPRLTASLGYSFLFWDRVVRAGDQIDTTINPTFIPPATSAAGPIRPAFSFQTTHFWAQGIDLGLEFNF